MEISSDELGQQNTAYENRLNDTVLTIFDNIFSDTVLTYLFPMHSFSTPSKRHP